jgi:DNA invertase Pin-like site-specific DNA recombinase
MSALPDPKSLASLKAVLFLSARGGTLLVQRDRLRLFAVQLGLAVVDEVVFRRRRRTALGEQFRAALPSGAAVVVIDSLSGLAKDPLAALIAAAEIRSTGIRLVSAEEEWLSEVGPFLPALGGWVGASLRAQRAGLAKAALSRARAEGRAIGRPRAKIDVKAALRLLSELGSVERTAAAISVGESTLRRALRTAACTPASAPASTPASTSARWSPAVLAGGVQ